MGTHETHETSDRLPPQRRLRLYTRIAEAAREAGADGVADAAIEQATEAARDLGEPFKREAERLLARARGPLHERSNDELREFHGPEFTADEWELERERTRQVQERHALTGTDIGYWVEREALCELGQENADS